MALLVGFMGAILGTLVGVIATYLTTRSNMRLMLEHSYDQAIQAKRIDRYQELFRITKCLPRYWPPSETEPGRGDLVQYLQDFHQWYFGDGAGGLFLTPAAKDVYMELLNLLAETAFKGGEASGTGDHPLSEAESLELRRVASDLRGQLSEDVGAASPPQLRWARPRGRYPLPNIVGR